MRAALQLDRDNDTLVLSRIYGLGGKDFVGADAEVFFNEAAEAAVTQQPAQVFAYHGATPGRRDKRRAPGPAADPRRARCRAAWPKSRRTRPRGA